jgi:diadenylate cyclase
LLTLFIHIRILDLLDIFFVAVLLFMLYKLLKGTAAINIFLGIVAVFVLWKITAALKMQLLADILGAFISVGIIALLIIFQPEIRQFLLALGTPSFLGKYGKHFSFLSGWFESSYETDTDPVVAACQHMSNMKQGALIVITRQNELQQIVNTGVIIDAEISTPLIENIFFKNSPLHDGAMIINHNRIKAAGCVLPVSKKKLPRYAGLRHRAAVGLTEVSDAIAIVVSEETGHISYCTGGNIRHNIEPSTLQQKLISDLGLANEENMQEKAEIQADEDKNDKKT